MDWFSWLSKTGLDPSVVYDYGLAFSNNELEESDLAYFDHEFLQSMGISIAKHRLEILKHASKHRRGRPARFSAFPVSRLLVAITGMKRRLGEYVKGWKGRKVESSAIMVIHAKGRGYYGGMSRRSSNVSARLKRNRMVGSANGRLLLTDGSDSVTEPVVSTARKEDKFEDDGCWSKAGAEELRWDALFQNLKPT